MTWSYNRTYEVNLKSIFLKKSIYRPTFLDFLMKYGGIAIIRTHFLALENIWYFKLWEF